MTNESEAMEVWRKALEAWNRAGFAGQKNYHQAAARVIATALEARDAELASLRTMLEASRRNCRTRDDQIDARDARIRELEGALEQIQLMVEDEAYKVTAGQESCKHTAALNAVHGVVAAILTKGKTHD